MTFRIEGLDGLNRTLLKISPTFRAEATKAVNRTAGAIKAQAISSILRNHTSGITYKKKDPDRVHTASTPGSPPNNDTGLLAGRIRHVETGTPSATVEVNAEYAKWLEFGTRNMAARPFLTPAVESNRAKYDTAIEVALKKAIRESVK